jgi:multicomponent Na+:H+ antiporter subunit G
MQSKKRRMLKRRKPKMIALQWIRFIIGMAFLICGVIVFGIELYGVFKFKYVLNRMHAAAMGDTLGIALSMIGLIILCGINFTSVKMILVIVFLWFASPVASHTVARFEVATNEEPDKDFEKKEMEK